MFARQLAISPHKPSLFLHFLLFKLSENMFANEVQVFIHVFNICLRLTIGSTTKLFMISKVLSENKFQIFPTKHNF